MLLDACCFGWRLQLGDWREAAKEPRRAALAFSLDALAAGPKLGRLEMRLS
jgi:hypothetical protein